MELDIIRPQIFPADKIISGVTTKNIAIVKGEGLSFAPCEIMSEEETLRHREILAGYLKIPFGKLKFQHQVHGTEIQIIDKDSGLKDSDGMLCNEKSLILAVKIADCGALLIYDPEKEAVGAIHSGWRGTMQNIAAIGINKMNTAFGSKPEKLLVYLSPCASGENYEVGWDVAQYFPESSTKLDKGKYLFDNKKEIFSQLIQCGVKAENIEISPFCTIADSNLHSYRRDKEKSGRMAAFIGLV